MPMDDNSASRTGRRAPPRRLTSLLFAVLLAAGAPALAEEEWVYLAEKDDNLWNLATE